MNCWFGFYELKLQPVVFPLEGEQRKVKASFVGHLVNKDKFQHSD